MRSSSSDSAAAARSRDDGDDKRATNERRLAVESTDGDARAVSRASSRGRGMARAARGG
jgi:hypothetical protein